MSRSTISNPSAAQRSIERVIAGDVHRSLGLKNRVPSVCQVLDSRKFCEESHARGDKLGAGVFTIGEILAGAYKSGRLTEAQQIKEFLGGGEVRVLQFGTDAAERYAFIRASHNLSPAMRLISPPPPSLMSMFT